MVVVVAFFDMFSQLPIITPYAQSLGATPLLMGLAVGMYSATNMVGNILAGRWIDKAGAKKVLIIGLILTAVILLFYPVVKNGEQLVLLRFIHGMAAGLLAPSAFTMMSDRAGTSNVGKTMAHSGAAVGMAAILGPAFSAIVGSKLGREWIFVIVAMIMAVTGIAVTAVARKENLNRESERGKEKSFNSNGSSFTFIRNPLLINAYIGSFSLMFALGILAYMLPLQSGALGFGDAAPGLMMSTFGIVAIALFLMPTNIIYDRLDPQKVMIAGMAVVSFSLVMLSFFTAKMLMFISMGIFGLGFALMFPSMNTIILRNVDENVRGKAFGIFYALFSIGVIAGSFLVGLVEATPALGFGIGALVVFGMGIVVGGIYAKKLSSKKGWRK